MTSDHDVSEATETTSERVSRNRTRLGRRAKVTRACDRCKKRKIKCNSAHPCDFCLRAKVRCTFDSAYARGRVPPIPSASNAETASHGLQGEDLMTPSQSPLLSEPQFSTMGSTEAAQPSSELPSAYPATSAYATTSSHDSPEPDQTDLQGHYIGPASGVSFLLRVQKRLHQAISNSDPDSIFTFGDAPLHPPEFDPSFCMMLPKSDAQGLVDRYFEFAMPTYRFLHRPTIQSWFEEFYDTLGVMRDTLTAPAKVAVLFMILAHARVYLPDNEKPGPSDLSVRYYMAAEHQLTKERGSVRLTSVQARLTQCLYLLSQSRINHCWSLFGNVSRLALAIGLNRNRRADATNGLTQVEVESRRRAFWCAYTLDTYLSAALGRPRSFNDEDIDVELPACLEDHELPTSNAGTASLSKGQPIMLAPIAQMRLARIIARILRDLYSVKPISSSRRAVLTDSISQDLKEWRATVARFLDADFFSTSLLIPIFQRQRNVLNLTFWHAIILTHRPFVLSNFTRSSRQGRSTEDDARTEESVQQCLMAAMNTVNTIDEIATNSQLFRAFWIATYFAFTATIVLYIYILQKRTSPPEVYSKYFSAASRCQSHIAAVAEKDSLPERYCLVLDELRAEALRQTKRMQSSLTGLEGLESRPQEDILEAISVPMDNPAITAADYTDFIGETAVDFNSMTDPTMLDYSGWGQFASMVTSGLGNLDAFLI